MAPLSTLVVDTKPFPGNSIGRGSLSPEGVVVGFNSDLLAASPGHSADGPRRRRSPQMSISPQKLATRFLRKSSSFLRVADLEIDVKTASITTQESEESQPGYHHPSCEPPPGIAHDPKEQWVALNDSDGIAPIAPIAIERLADFGMNATMNRPMWCPDSKTERALQRGSCPRWMKDTFKPGCVKLQESDSLATDVLVWSGSFKHGLYGSDLPAIRAAGIINMSARALMELLVDSDRVKEYNKMSLGRTDLQIFQHDMSLGPFGGVTKVMKSETKPPMVRKNLVFVSILHAKELIDGSGYLLVTRAVHHPEQQGTSNAIQSEILIGVNLIRKIEGAEDSLCLMINVNHIRSPMVPMMIAKRIGVSAAISFINDIRAIC